MWAAARRPDAVLSLALLEPPAFATADGEDRARTLVRQLQELWDEDIADEEWLAQFLTAVGTDLHGLPPEVLAESVPLVPLLRRGRVPWNGPLPLEALAEGTFPKIIISGGHSEAFDSACDSLAAVIDARRAVVEGAGHEIQFTGTPINQVLLNLWATSA